MKRARLQQRVAVAAMLVGTACAALLLQQQAQHPGREAAAAAGQAAFTPAAPALWRVGAQDAPAAAAVRRVYPYSIVPGGVTDRMDLARAVMADKVVAAHYAGFAVDKASLRTVARARAVYVSYRKGDKVYWTAHKVTLAEGETVLSDGRNDIRARCGNRISDTPRFPVEAKGPAEHELDTPLEQAPNGDEGALREVAFAVDEQDGGGRQFVPQSFPNGAGLLAAAQPQAGPGQSRLDSQFEADRRLALLASLAGQPYTLGARVTGGSATNGGAANAPGEPATGGDSAAGTGNTGGTGGARTEDAGGTGGGTGGGIGDTAADGTGSAGGGTGDTAPNGGGSGSGSTTGDAGGSTGGPGSGSPNSPYPGSKPGGDTGNPPLPGLRTDLPSGDIPAGGHDLPEPDSLWLSGLAAALLLLQRRRRPRRPR